VVKGSRRIGLQTHPKFISLAQAGQGGAVARVNRGLQPPPKPIEQSFAALNPPGSCSPWRRAPGVYEGPDDRADHRLFATAASFDRTRGGHILPMTV
jgi:hypothetical protein